MSSRDDLDHYLQQARQRLRLVLLSRGAAMLLGLLFLLTLLAALWITRAVFSDVAVGLGRGLLVVALLATGTFLFLRWRDLNRNEGGDALERALPAQSGRINTYLEERRKDGNASFLLDLLADDAVRIADAEPVKQTIPAKHLWIPGAVAGVALAGLIGVMFLGGSLGDGARHLWLGELPPASRIAVAAGGIAVRPGDISVRRNQDLPITALVAGSPSSAEVHVRFGNGEWETAPMSQDKDGGYSFTLFAVRDAAQYYVSAGGLRSKEHRIEVVDLPQIESLRLTYNYPAWTGLPQQVQEAGGDIRAVAGTRVALEVKTDKPLTTPLLIVNGASSSLKQTDRITAGNVNVQQPGHYRIATRFGDEIVPLTEDYIIDVVPDEKPTVQILRPGRDYRATNIEEVPVGVKAIDDFRLEALELHYSVNGGEWQKEKLPAGSADIQAAALLRLEEMQQQGPRGESPLLVPGDLVSYYALARDHGSSAQTDLFLIQVQPFEQRYTQSQANGGGGGGGGGEQDENQISQKQREVLLATWNLQRNRSKEGGRAAERDADNARMLSEVQNTLADQAGTLVERARARELTGQDEKITAFVKSLEEAAKAMRPAARALDDQQLEAAVKHEQQALQHLLRAEAAFREIQVSMQRGGGGGGGGGQQARDVSEMTELEMDLAKNQYETQSEMSQQQQNQAEDEVMKKLRELARRQEQLAREAARQQTPPEQQRWQQEQLRREAEELRRQLEQLAQQQRGGQQQSGQQGGQQSQGQQGGSQQSASASAAAEAARQVSEAMREMQARNGNPQNANRASEQLNRAREQLERGQRQATGDRFNELARAARELTERQRQSEQDLRAALGPQTPQAPSSIARPGAQQQRSGLTFEQAQRLAESKREVQEGLEELQRQMRAARQQSGARTPRANEQVAEAGRELEESGTAARLARSVTEIERGRGVQAATREGLINEGLEQLQQSLEEAASVASAENGQRRDGPRDANAEDLLAELGDLRRALERARAQGVAQNGRNAGDAGTRSPDAREGQAGQDGGRSGQQGQGEQAGERGQGGSQPGNEGGRAGGADGGDGDFGRVGGGGGPDGGARGRFLNGGLVGTGPLPEQERRALREQGQLSSQRLQQLREQLANGALAEADVRALRELSDRLRRGGADPLSAEYPRMVSLLNQLELAALQAQRESVKDNPARANGSVDDSRRYRDNVAEYYRRLGETNDR